METRLRRKATQDGLSTSELYSEKQICVNSHIIGKPDGETDTHVIERKSLKNWKHAVGQVLVYAKCLHKKPKIILHEEVPVSPDYRNTIVNICNGMGIETEVITYTKAKEDSEATEKDWRYLLKREYLYELLPSDTPKNLDKSQLCSLCKDISLENLKKDHLYYIAGEVDIKHRSSMKKDQLLSILKEKFPVLLPPKIEAPAISVPPVIETKTQSPSDNYSSLKVEQLRDLLKTKGIKLPASYIKKESLLSILRDPSSLPSILTKL